MVFDSKLISSEILDDFHPSSTTSSPLEQQFQTKDTEPKHLKNSYSVVYNLL